MFAIDCSMYPPQDYLRTAHGEIALYATIEEAQYVVKLIGGKVIKWED